MSRFKSSIRLRLLVLTSLIIVTTYTAIPQQAATACIVCVELTGGLCIGCDPNPTTGFKWCAVNQDACQCRHWDECNEAPQGN